MLRRPPATIDAILDRHARRHVGVAVGTLAGGEVRHHARGPVAADTIFEIGSITKVFTGTLLALLAAEGVVALEDPVARHLPPGAAPPVRGGPIRLVDLSTHSSGLPRVGRRVLRRALTTDRRNPYARYSVDNLYADLPRVRLRGAPGRRFRYSNLGAGLLGHVLALRAGRSYEELVRERICAPLGMVDTWVTVPADARDRFADGHDRRGRPVSHWDLPTLAGAGALRSTVTDLLAWAAFALDPPDTPLGRAVALAQRPWLARRRMSIGLGWLRLRRRRLDIVFHNGGTGGFRSFLAFAPASRTAVAVLSSSGRSVDAIGMGALLSLR